jgi:hypothetical protein
VLSRNSTWTLTRDASLGVVFAGINYYDGQGFMVPKKLKIDSAKKMQRRHGLRAGRHDEREERRRLLRRQRHEVQAVVFDTAEAITSAFFAGRCQVYTTDMSDLAGARTKAPNADDYVILPQVISKEPLGPSVRRGDDEWFQIVRWTLYAMIDAEETADPGQRRPAEDDNKDPACSASSAFPRTPASCSASTRSGPTASSSRWATTARASSATSGPNTPVEAAARRQQPVDQGRPDVRPPIR